jgi:release factor glutamine methyltransferase
VAERVEVVCGDLFSAFDSSLRADIIVTNPPYIDSASIGSLQPEVAEHEPREALDGGDGGLEIIGNILGSAAGFLRSGGHLILEAGEGQAEDVSKLADGEVGWQSHEILADHAGHPRVHILDKE